MVSRKIFSLVIPRYAARPCQLAAAGVHRFDGVCWVKLTPEEASRRLQHRSTVAQFQPWRPWWTHDDNLR